MMLPRVAAGSLPKNVVFPKGQDPCHGTPWHTPRKGAHFENRRTFNNGIMAQTEVWPCAGHHLLVAFCGGKRQKPSAESVHATLKSAS